MFSRSAALALTAAAGTAVTLFLRSHALRHPSTPGTAKAKLEALMAEHWEWRMTTFPELAAFFGEAPRAAAAAPLDDRSPAAYEAVAAHASDMLRQLRGIPATCLASAGAWRVGGGERETSCRRVAAHPPVCVVWCGGRLCVRRLTASVCAA